MKFTFRLAFMAVVLAAPVVPAFCYEIPEAVYPAVPGTGSSAEAFVPEGWTIEVESRGDLNGDKRDDLLLVLKGTDPANMITNDDASPGMEEWDANPRILAIAFAEKKGGYSLVLKSDDFLPRHEDPCIDDPFGGAEIVDGTIRISFGFFANAGSWYTSGTTYVFRYLTGRFRLVAYSNFTAKRNTGDTWDIALDYVAGTGEITVGNFTSDEEDGERTITKAIPKGQLVSLEDIASGFDYYPEQLDLSWWGISEESEYDEEYAEE